MYYTATYNHGGGREQVFPPSTALRAALKARHGPRPWKHEKQQVQAHAANMRSVTGCASGMEGRTDRAQGASAWVAHLAEILGGSTTVPGPAVAQPWCPPKLLSWLVPIRPSHAHCSCLLLLLATSTCPCVPRVAPCTPDPQHLHSHHIWQHPVTRHGRDRILLEIFDFPLLFQTGNIKGKIRFSAYQRAVQAHCKQTNEFSASENSPRYYISLRKMRESF